MKIAAFRNNIMSITFALSNKGIKNDVLLLEKIINHTKNLQDDIDLTLDDIYKYVIWILDDGSKSLLETAKQIQKSETGHIYLTETILLLHHDKILDIKSFKKLCQLDQSDNVLFYGLLKLMKGKNKSIVADQLNAIFTFITSIHKDSQADERISDIDQASVKAEVFPVKGQDKKNKKQEADWFAMMETSIKFLAGSISIVSLPMIGMIDGYQLLSKSEQEERLRTLDFDESMHLTRILNDLAQSNLLDKSSFEKAFTLVISKIKNVQPSAAAKVSRHDKKTNHSQFFIKRSGNLEVNFFLEHNNIAYPSGTFGKVKKGYADDEGNNPKFAIKKYTTSGELTEEAYLLITNESRTAAETAKLEELLIPITEAGRQKALREASREAKYHVMLGRDSHFFARNNNVYLLAPWYGQSINNIPASVIRNISLLMRVKCLEGGLSELAVIHSHHRVHGDIKPDNVILDPSEMNLHIIDFGNAHKNHLKNYYPMTPTFDDGYSYSTDYCDDIYGFGYIVAHLFPELFEIDKRTSLVTTNSMGSSLIEKAVIALWQSLMNPVREERCRADDAASYCMGVLKKNSGLDRLKKSTIQRAAIDVEDVLRGKLPSTGY